MKLKLKELFIAGLTVMGYTSAMVFYVKEESLFGFLNLVMFFLIMIFVLYKGLVSKSNRIKLHGRLPQWMHDKQR